MHSAINILDVSLAVMYLVLFAIYIKSFFDSERPPRRFLSTLFPALLVVHLVKLILQGVCDGHCPIAAFGETFSFTAFCLGLIYITARRRRIYCAEGAVFVGLVCLFQLVSIFAATNNILVYERLKDIPFGFHAPVALIGMALFAASALYGILYIAMFKLLKTKNPVFPLDELPPLERVESMLDFSMTSGTAFFGFAIISGFVIGKIYNLPIFTDPKIIVSLFVFAVFAFGVIGSRFYGFSGYRKSAVSIFGFITAILSMTVVRIYLAKLHSFQP